MKLFLRRWGVVLFAGFCFCSFVCISLMVQKGRTAGFDETVYLALSHIRFPFLDHVLMFLTQLCNPWVLFCFAILCLLFLRHSGKGLWAVLNLGNIALLNMFLKLLFSRSRPTAWMLIPESGFSFPSGHAMAATAFYGFLIYLLWKTSLSKGGKKVGTIFLIVLIAIISVSRIYLGVHYASDVLAGILLSISYLIVFIEFTKKIEGEVWWKKIIKK